MHHGTCITHVPWCILGSLITRGGGENVPGIPETCAYVTYSVKQDNHAVQYDNASGCSTFGLHFCKPAGIIGPQSIIDHIATRLRENWRCIRNGIWKAIDNFCLHSVWNESVLLSDVYEWQVTVNKSMTDVAISLTSSHILSRRIVCPFVSDWFSVCTAYMKISMVNLWNLLAILRMYGQTVDVLSPI